MDAPDTAATGDTITVSATDGLQESTDVDFVLRQANSPDSTPQMTRTGDSIKSTYEAMRDYSNASLNFSQQYVNRLPDAAVVNESRLAKSLASAMTPALMQAAGQLSTDAGPVSVSTSDSTGPSDGATYETNISLPENLPAGEYTAADETHHDVTLVVDDREVDMRTTSTATVELADASGTKSLRIVADATTSEDPGDDPGEDPGGSDPGGDDPDGAPPSDQPAATTTPNPTTTTPPTTTADTTTQTPATTTANPTTPETTTRTPTATSTESPPTTEPDSQPNETDTNIPGFTVPTAVIAMLSAALLALRRRD